MGAWQSRHFLIAEAGDTTQCLDTSPSVASDVRGDGAEV
jgi:hypothetical protein